MNINIFLKIVSLSLMFFRIIVTLIDFAIDLVLALVWIKVRKAVNKWKFRLRVSKYLDKNAVEELTEIYSKHLDEMFSLKTIKRLLDFRYKFWGR
ncbi:MAG: hypothetical protein DRJ47_00750 [Thermoprotei archaeon]|nr:MAG: hypothetical protein DRJ47_00750 [Thermoprotei archaeon]